MVMTTYIVDLEPRACIDLLARSGVGRLGVVVAGRPEIFPINHVYDRASGCVVFPSNAGTKLRAALDWPWVGFEVDGVAEDGSGWSVMVVGRAEEMTDPEEVARVARQRDVPWRGGEAVHWVRIVPSKVTGRQISASATGSTIHLS